MTDPTTTDFWTPPEPTRARRAVVIVDVVESVRRMQEDEAGFIDVWRGFVHHARATVLPSHAGRLVKSLGDGMLLEFEHVRQAVAAALALHALADSMPSGLALRMGLHEADVVIDALDIYGQGVNLAARLATLARPGDVVLSDAARDQLLDGWDAEIEDLGLCYVKHIEGPLRAFRVRSSRPATRPPTTDGPESSLVPTLVVLPLSIDAADEADRAVARVLVDDLVATLSACSGWRVLSALSSSALADRRLSSADLSGRLGADYALSGSLVRQSGALRLSLQLTTEADGEPVWTREASLSVDDLLTSEDRLACRVAREASQAVLLLEWRSAREAALPSLRGYSLLLHAISLMHRVASDEHQRSFLALEHLVERHPRAAAARAWMAKWHFLQLPQRRSRDRDADIARARSHIGRALDLDPANALAAALQAHLCSYVDRQPAAALAGVDLALRHNPSEPLAWLFRGNALALLGRGPEAVEAAQRACALSPLDPMAYFFDTFASLALRIAGRHEEAVARAQRSLRANATHLPGWVQLILAQAAYGDLDGARRSAAAYLALQPAASVQRYVDFHAGTDLTQVAREAQALREAGIPA